MADGDYYGYWSGADGTRMSYWAGGMQQENMCGCGITKTCDQPDVNCNCDIADGKARRDFGWITNRADLPVGSVTFNEIGGSSQGMYSVGWLGCSQAQFGMYI